MNAEIEKLLCRHEEEKAALAAEQMRRYVDMSIPENRQRVEGVEIRERLRAGRLRPEEACHSTETLLRLTYREGTERVPFWNELRLINDICKYLRCMGQKEKAISEYKEVLGRFEKSRVQAKYHFLSEGLILDNMILYMFHSGNIDEVEEWSVKRAIQQLLNGKINTVHYVLSNFVGIEESCAEKEAGGPIDFTSSEADFRYSGVREKCLQYMEWAICITDIFKQYFIRSHFIEFEKENLGADRTRD